ncbi:hypothetical protein D3C74_262650 [compost metagenome]
MRNSLGGSSSVASSQQHKNQFQKNKVAIDKVKTLQAPPNDWLITMAFYAAVHLIEYKIVDLTGRGTGSHTARQNEMNKLKTVFRPIAPYYSTLETYSHRSRYRCESFHESDVNKILSYLEDIEKHILDRTTQ